MYIAITLEQKTRNYINNNTVNLKDTDKEKLFNKSIELFLYIESIGYNQYEYISSKYLQETFRTNINKQTFNYTFFLDLLININAIKVNESYLVNEYSKSYKINHLIYDTIEMYKLKKSFLDSLKKKIVSKSKWIKKYPHLKQQIESTYKFEIDVKELIKYCIENKDIFIKKGTLKNQYGQTLIIDKYLDTKTIYHMINECIKINHRVIWFKETKEGRLYSSITNLNNIALQFSTIDNRPLYEVDGVNFQPLLFTKYFNNTQYKKDCESGQFYDILASEFNLSREEIKLKLYKHVFFAKHTKVQNKFIKSLERKYKGFTQCLIDNNTEFSKLFEKLQNTESNIFVKGTQNINKTFITKHDSILVCYEDVEYWQSILKVIAKNEGINNILLKVKKLNNC